MLLSQMGHTPAAGILGHERQHRFSAHDCCLSAYSKGVWLNLPALHHYIRGGAWQGPAAVGSGNIDTVVMLVCCIPAASLAGVSTY